MGNDSNLDIIVRARNEASRVLNQVRGDAQKVSGAIGKTFKAAVPASQALGVAVAAAGVATVAFGKQSVDAYFAAQEASTKLKTNVLNVKGATDQHVASLEKLASKLQSVGVIEDDVIKAGMSQLATFNLQADTIGKLTPKILDMVTQLKGHNATAEDMVNINNLVGKVMTGNVGALSRYGVTLSETQKEQLKNGNETERAAVLNEVLAQNYGKVNEALRNTPQGAITAFKNAFGDLQEGVGEFIVNAAYPVIQALNQWVAKVDEAGGFIEYFKKLIQDNQGAVYALGTAIVVGLIPAIVSAVISMGPAILALGAIMAVGALLGPQIKKLVDNFGGWGAVMERVKGGIKAVVGAVKLLITGDFNKQIGEALGASEDSPIVSRILGIRDTIISLANTVKTIVVTAFNIFVGVIQFLMPSLQALWNTISTQLIPALVNLWNTVAPVLLPVLKTLGIIIGVVVVAAIWLAINVLNVIIKVVAWLANAFSTLFGIATTVFNGIVAVIQTVYNFVAPIFRAIFAVAKFQFQAIYLAVAVVVSLIMAVVRPIANFIGGVFRSAVNIVRGAWNGISGFFGGIVNAIRSRLSGVTSAITGPFSRAYEWVKGLPGRIANAIGNVGQVLRDKLGDWDIPGPLGKVRDVIPGFATGVRNFAGGMAYVHKGEMLVNLPPGTDVLTRGQTNQMLEGGSGGVTNNFYGPITLDGDAAVDRFFSRLNRASELADMGTPT